MEGFHKSVLVGEVLRWLEVEAGKWCLDATAGDGGYGLEILKKGGNLVGMDVDPEALQRAESRFRAAGFDSDRFRLIQGNFRDLKINIEKAGLKNFRFKGVIFDLGISTLQLKSPERGFSFALEGPLDMRMDPTLAVSAQDLIKALTKEELYELFTRFSEEKYARRFAEAVVLERRVRPIQTTKDLAEILEKAAGKRGRIHPATRVFQALRIAVNDELNALKEALPQALDLTEVGGLLMVISFHSLEDRIVKQTFNSWQDQSFGEVLTKKPLTPEEGEIKTNYASRSAKLRIFKSEKK